MELYLLGSDLHNNNDWLTVYSGLFLPLVTNESLLCVHELVN